MGMGKFTREWGIFCGDGVGMGKILWGWGGDGDNYIYRVTLYNIVNNPHAVHLLILDISRIEQQIYPGMDGIVFSTVFVMLFSIPITLKHSPSH